MSRDVTVGLDGSPESTAAADWAADEALLRAAPLRLVHAWLWQQPYAYLPRAGAAVPPVDDQQEEWGPRLLRQTAARIAERHPGLRVSADLIAEPPVTGLLAAAEDTDLLVLGSRGLGGVRGFLVGSVALAVVARAKAPLALVRAGERAGEQSPTGDIVLGLDLEHPDATVIGFAFDAAARRGAGLRVVHGGSLPPYDGYGGALDAGLDFEFDAPAQRELAEVLRPWQEKFPGVETHGQVVVGSAAPHLVEASRDAALVVVGRRRRRSPAGLHVGPVTQPVLHHAMAPVVVVPHD